MIYVCAKIGVETGKWCFNRVIYVETNQFYGMYWNIYHQYDWTNGEFFGQKNLEMSHSNHHIFGGWASISPRNFRTRMAPGLASSMRKLHICPPKIAIMDFPHWVHDKCIAIRMALWQLWENMENCPNLEWKIIPIIPRKESFMVFNNKILILGFRILDTQIAILGSSILPSHISFLLDWLVHTPSWIKSIENPRFCVMYMYTLW